MAPRVLIVEDEHIVAMDIQICLQNLGYLAPTVVSTGEDAIAQVEQESPDLVLMDIRLAGQMDGVEAASRICQRFDIPVIYLTAQVDSHTLDRAKETGPFGYILKPFEERDLHTTVEMALSKHQMEQRLRESEERLRRAFENALDAVITMDAEGKITDWNRQAEKAFGWSRSEVIGRPLAETIIPPGQRAEHQRGLKQYLTTGSGPLLNKRVEGFTALHRNGREFPVELSITPVRCGGRVSFSAFVRDITERVLARQRLEESEQKYRTLVETTGTGYVILDEQGRVLDANAEYVRLSGHLTLQDIQGRPAFSWHAAHDSERSQEALRKCLERGFVRNLEVDYLDPEGNITPIEFNGTAVDTEEGQLVIGLCRDITERRQAEEALKRSNADLDEYVHVVSHDLKDPLGMIMRHVQFLERRYRDQLDDRAQEHISKVILGTRNMARLIDELKENSEIGQGRSETVDCQSAFGEVVDNLQTLISEHAATVRTDPLPTITANRTDMVQLFQNLIGNAIRFCAESRPSEVHVSCVRQGAEWRFAVRDNGIGIAPEHCDRIFNMFERLGEKDVEGTGVGLANCRKAVERRGGRIWVESELGVGSTFFFTLPVRSNE